MDPLSGAASVIAVVSLVAQVSDSIKKLNDFRLSVKNAPQDIIQLGDQLVVLEDILKAVSRKIQAANNLQSLEIDASHPLYGAIRVCQNLASELKQAIEYFETRYQRRGAKNLRTSVLAGWKKGRIQELKDRLDFACKVLLLQGTLGCSNWQVGKVSVAISDRAEEASQQLQAQADIRCSPLPHVASLSALPVTHSRRNQQELTIFSLLDNVFNPAIRNRRTILKERTWTSRFGILRIRTYINTYYLSSEKGLDSSTKKACTLQESEFRFIPSWGSAGLQLWTSCSSNQWIPSSLRPSIIVPDNSNIFVLCLDTKHDNTLEVLNAFRLGRASPFDTNTRGESLLHAAAFACNPVLCQALLKCGSDPSALDSLGNSPLNHATFGFPDGVREIETCRVLVGQGQMDPWDLFVKDHADPTPLWNWLGSLAADLCLWVLGQDKPWFDLERVDRNGWSLLEIVIELWILDTFFRDPNQSEWIRPMKWLIRAGSNLHRRGRRRQTILGSMACQALSFELIVQYWFVILASSGVDVAAYIQIEKQIYEEFIATHDHRYDLNFRYLTFPDDPYKDSEILMRYIPHIAPDHEICALFDLYKDLMSLSEWALGELFRCSYTGRAYFSERRKERVREDRELRSEPVHMARRTRKLSARLAITRICWSKVRARAMLEMDAMSTKIAEVHQSDESVPMIPAHASILVKYFALEPRPFHLLVGILLVISLGANVLLFRLWMSS